MDLLWTINVFLNLLGDFTRGLLLRRFQNKGGAKYRVYVATNGA